MKATPNHNARLAGIASGIKRQTPKVISDKAECVRLHVELGIGVQEIGRRLNRSKKNCREWLIKAGVYKPKSRKELKNWMSLWLVSKWIRDEYRSEAKIIKKTDDCAHWLDRHELAKYLCMKRYYSDIESNRKRLRDLAKKRYDAGLPLHVRIKRVCATRIWKAIKLGGGKKDGRTEELLGCSVQDFMARLQSMWLPGMSWLNYGKWHIDHIKPCSKFDLTDRSQLLECFHYSNQQPLWAHDNLSKNDRY